MGAVPGDLIKLNSLPGDRVVDLGVVPGKVKKDESWDYSTATSFKVPSPSVDGEAANKGWTITQIENYLAGLDFQPDVNDVVADANTTAPGVGLPAAATGQRYILQSNTGSLHANWGTITGVGDNDIVEYDGADWFVAYDVSAQGEGALTWDQDSNEWYRWDGTDWTYFGGLSGVTAGAGLDKSGDTIFVGDAGKGVQVNADDVQVDASEIAGDGLQQVSGEGNEHLLELKLAADSGLQLTGAGLDELAVNPEDFAGEGLEEDASDNLQVQIVNTSINRSASGIKSAVPTTNDKQLDTNSISTDGQDTGIDITSAPAAGSEPKVLVNGIKMVVGNGVKTKDFYFSGDGGSTARAWGAIVASDSLYFNAVIAGFNLVNGTHKIDLDYVVA